MCNKGDFNARAGNVYSIWEGALRRHGVRKVYDNGLLFLGKCEKKNSLCITRTCFKMTDKYKTSSIYFD